MRWMLINIETVDFLLFQTFPHGESKIKWIFINVQIKYKSFIKM